MDCQDGFRAGWRRYDRFYLIGTQLHHLLDAFRNDDGAQRFFRFRTGADKQDKGEEGSGSKVLEETCKRLGSPEAIEAELRERFVIGANKAYAVTRLMKKAKFILVTALDKQLAKDMLFTAAVDEVDEALKLAEQYVGKDYTMTLMPTGSLTVPLYKG